MRRVLEFDNVSKLYRLGENSSSLREAIVAASRKLFSRGTGAARPEMWALKDLSLEVRAGEALGIIGPNGAGKTTVLKLLSRITQPTLGRVRTTGRVSSLIELGAGFHPDLTGRDNIFLNGTILGMTRDQIRKRFDEIVDFSGLEGFLDTPVKRYSSGMYARLGFSVAAYTGAQILLVDEVLAVGDLNFQARCVERMRELVRNGTAVVFISHSLYYVGYFCSHALLLHRGEARAFGKPQQAIASYQRLLSDLARGGRTPGSGDAPDAIRRAQVLDVRVLDQRGMDREIFQFGETLFLSIRGCARERIPGPVVRISIFSSDGFRCFSSHNRMAKVQFPDVEGEFEVRIELSDLRLMPDAYSISVALLDSEALAPYDWKEFCAGFRMTHPHLDNCVESGAIYLPHRWDFNQVAVPPGD